MCSGIQRLNISGLLGQVLVCTYKCRHNCRTSNGYLSSQLCIWVSLRNASQALQVMLLCQLWGRLRPGTEVERCCSLLLGMLAAILTPACAVRRFASLWCPAWACCVQLWRARLETFQLSQHGRGNWIQKRFHLLLWPEEERLSPTTKCLIVKIPHLQEADPQAKYNSC